MVVDGRAADVDTLATHKLVRMRVAAASHPGATAAVLARLAGDSSPNVRRVVGARPETAVKALQRLATDPDRATREAVAGNTSTPPDTLISLLSDRDFDVRYAATTNPAADLRVQRAMCASPVSDVREVLAQRPGLPPEIVGLLARDPHRQVRETIAHSVDLPAVLQTLLDDPNPAVRATAAQNPHTTAAQRRQLTRDPAAQVRASVVHAMARHGWNIAEEDLLRLAADRSLNVRFWVANLPGSTRPVYETLAEDPDDQIAVSARQWLQKPAGPGHTVGRRRFSNPAQLGRPILEIENHVWNQYMNRGSS